jgi:hypothetical protein
LKLSAEKSPPQIAIEQLAAEDFIGKCIQRGEFFPQTGPFAFLCRPRLKRHQPVDQREMRTMAHVEHERAIHGMSAWR